MMLRTVVGVSNFICVFAIVFAAIMHIDASQSSQSPQSNCKPFNGYFVWYHSKNEDDFNVQKHFLSRMLDNVTCDTNIRLNTGDFIVSFMIHDSESVFENVAYIKHDPSQGNVMSYISLKEDISENFHKKKSEALELFFFVNNISKIDEEVTASKELKKNKVFVAYDGPEPIPDFLKSLATDDHHLLHLKHFIEEEFLAFLNVICHDSRLYCDNDMFWEGTECFRCSFICTQMPSEYCKQECPYFEPPPLDKKVSTCESNNTLTIVLIVSAIITFLLILGVIGKCAWDWRKSSAPNQSTSNNPNS